MRYHTQQTFKSLPCVYMWLLLVGGLGHMWKPEALVGDFPWSSQRKPTKQQLHPARVFKVWSTDGP